MTNREWLDSLNQIQLRVVAGCWVLPDSATCDIESLKAELVQLEDLQSTPTRREEIYTERLLKYWNPSLMSRLPNPPLTATCVNDLCNDLVTIDAIIENNCFKVLEFVAHGCCISQCSTAMLIEYFRGKTVDEAQSFTRESMLDLVGIKITPAREGCVLLSLDCLRKICGQAKT
jgi:NifU-like protein involved in Fe-S cluster formation